MQNLISTTKRLYWFILDSKIQFYTFLYCIWYGLSYNKTWRFIGKPFIHRPYRIHKSRKTALILGNHVKLISSFDNNSIGLIQPVFLNVRGKDCKIIIGDRVGISGSTISAKKFISIGDDVFVGSGCLITDNDAHNIHYSKRDQPLEKKSIRPIFIEKNVFIGARTIILKGVTIGEGSVIGAGSVVTHSIPKFSIAAGNPAVIIKKFKENQK